MSKLTEAGVIHALNNKSWLYEGLKKNVRHEERPPYHTDIGDDIIPDNLNNYQDSSDFWLDDGFGYICPECNSAFMSPEQIGEYQEVECPYCEAIVHPESMDDEEKEEYEVDEDDSILSNATEDELEAVVDELDIRDEVEETIEEIEDNTLTESKQDVKRRRKKKARKANIQKALKMLGKNRQAATLLAKKRKIQSKYFKGSRDKDGLMPQSAFDKGKEKASKNKTLSRIEARLGNNTAVKKLRKAEATLNDNWSETSLLQMDENAVMAVINDTLSEAFYANREYVPFEVIDITRGSYRPNSDVLILEAVIQYEDGVRDQAKFRFDGIQSGRFLLTETTGAFDIDRYDIVGNSSIINESIVIN